MITCPQCKTTSAEVGIKGPVLIAEGVVEIGEDQRLTYISPLRATQTIRAGTELSCPDMLIICPKCGYAGALSTYSIARTCVITGEGTELTVQTDVGVFPVVARASEEAKRIFSSANFNWARGEIERLPNV